MLLKRDQHEPAKPLRSSKRGGIASLTPRDTLSQKKNCEEGLQEHQQQ